MIFFSKSFSLLTTRGSFIEAISKIFPDVLESEGEDKLKLLWDHYEFNYLDPTPIYKIKKVLIYE